MGRTIDIIVTFLSVSRENNSYNQEFLHNQSAQINAQHSYVFILQIKVEVKVKVVTIIKR